MRVKNVSGTPVVSPFAGGEIAAGQIVEVAESQPDGSPLIWPEDIWQRVETRPRSGGQADETTKESRA